MAARVLPFVARRTALLQSAALAVWTEVRRVLDKAGIASVPVKGLVTSRWLYENSSERELSDVDIRVRPADLRAVRDAGVAAGWRLIAFSRVYGNVLFEVAGLEVDIESSCGPPGFVALSVEDILARAAPPPAIRLAPLGPVPEVHDHALLLVVNVMKDHLVGATAWAFEDLRRIIRAPGVDPTRLIERAEGAAAVGMLYLVADRLAGDEPRWAALRARVEGRPAARGMARFYRALLRRDAPRWALRLGARAMSDGWYRRASSLGRALAWETERRAMAALAAHRHCRS